MHRHHQVSDRGKPEDDGSGTTRPASVPPWMIPLENAVFVAVTVAVTTLALVCVQLVRSPVVIGTDDSALVLAGAAAVGVAAATRTRAWAMRRRTPRH
ncbi:hypothetical protein ACIPSJ_46150 [Streptomyces sp. NPDC090088]|uniref:hypothetical protein n=1 Tax=Streptomyces sp. NPDC090088 TaxID=3365944 RepID=UPI0038238952